MGWLDTGEGAGCILVSTACMDGEGADTAVLTQLKGAARKGHPSVRLCEYASVFSQRLHLGRSELG